MSNEAVDYWNIVGKPAGAEDLDRLKVGDYVGLEECHQGKPWRRRVVEVSQIDVEDDGTRTLAFVNAPEDAEWPELLIITGNRAEDAKYR